MGATILHVDLDAFFASVEVLEDPSLRGKPVIVGGSGRRGVVAACTYEARAYGVRSAMPSEEARRLCPHATFLPGRHSLYRRYSAHVFDVFRSFTPLVEGISLDEAFLDVAGSRRLFGEPPAIAEAVRRRVRDEIGLTCSVGVAPSKLLAKLASEAAKPKASPRGAVPGKGVVVVEPGTQLEFLHPLPVQVLWGVGPATLRRLQRFGVRTVGDLASVPVDALVGALGAGQGRHLHDLAWARDERPVVPVSQPKSVSQEETYRHDLSDREDLRREVLRLAEGVAARLRDGGLAARTVTLKVRFHDFATITRSHTLATAVDTGRDVAAAALALLDGVDPGAGVRLLGVGASQLAESVQLSLDLGPTSEGAGGAAPATAAPARWSQATEAVDEVRRRFGDGAVGPAALIRRDRPPARTDDDRWGPDAVGER